MIKQTVIELGRGDIAIMPASSREDRQENAIAFVKRNVEYPIAVDVDCDVTDEEISNGTLGYIAFSNPKSIDAVVNMLNRLKEAITGEPSPSNQGEATRLRDIVKEIHKALMDHKKHPLERHATINALCNQAIPGITEER